MDHGNRTIRFGAAVLLWTVLVRLYLSGTFAPVVAWFQKPETQSFVVYLETGRIVRFSASMVPFSEGVEDAPGVTTVPETLEPTQPPTEPVVLPVFAPEELEHTDIHYSCSLRPDLEALLAQPLTWDLTGTEPKVLILHTHATESFTQHGEDYVESSDYRTLDENYNMVSIGNRVAQILQEAGITVIHDRQLHDYPSYNGSYNHARKSIAQILEQYPSICLVLDLHRDASGDPGEAFRPAISLAGEDIARIMLVMGTDAAGLKHPNWEENLALGLKLQAQLERQVPGITRPMSLRAQRFNQDMTPGSLLIEMGATGNSHEEVLRAAEQLAQAIIALSHGTAGGTAEKET